MNPNRLDPVLVLLATFVVFFTILLIIDAKFFANDGQTFQVISGLLTGYSGALIMRVTPSKKPQDDAETKQDATKPPTA